MPQITFHYSLYPEMLIFLCATPGRAFLFLAEHLVSFGLPVLSQEKPFLVGSLGWKVEFCFLSLTWGLISCLESHMKTTPPLHSFLCNIIKHPTSSRYSGVSEVNCTSYTLYCKSILQSPVKSLRAGGHSTFPDISRWPLDGMRKLVSAFSLISLSNVV